MTSKEKVLAIEPDAMCTKSPLHGIWINCRPGKRPYNYQIIVGENKLSFKHPRESWAWAEAYRNLTKEKK